MLVTAAFLSLSLSSAPPLAPRAWRDLRDHLSTASATADIDARNAAQRLRDEGCGHATFTIIVDSTATTTTTTTTTTAMAMAMTTTKPATLATQATLPVIARGRTASGAVCQVRTTVDVRWSARAPLTARADDPALTGR